MTIEDCMVWHLIRILQQTDGYTVSVKPYNVDQIGFVNATDRLCVKNAAGTSGNIPVDVAISSLINGATG
jgi:hypothetical protein